MKVTRTLGPAALFAALAVATAAVAGTAVYGYSSVSRADAARLANEEAAARAAQKWGSPRCMSRADMSQCTQSNGEWVCTAYVDNQQGSCDRKR